MKFKALALGLVTFFFFGVGAITARAAEPLQKLAQQAISKNKREANMAIAALRQAGPAGLDALIDAHRVEINRHLLMTDARSTPAWERLSQALDAVGKQRNCYVSQLYWYTDFEAAKATAKASGKPILSLRLLGNLDEELSCANSRFFRTILYANADVSEFLRQRFVLHWKSVRPVPKVTIDFGDGRKMERTITGNSIHYVLDSEGRVVDALPGLYGPQAFLRGLKSAQTAVLSTSDSSMNDDQVVFPFRLYHGSQLIQLTNLWGQNLTKLNKVEPLPSQPQPFILSAISADQPPTAVEASATVITKSLTIENRLLAKIELLGVPKSELTRLEATTDDQTWQALAELYLADAKLDERSRQFIRRQGGGTCGIPGIEGKKGSVEERFDQMVRNFEQLVALDTVRNEYLFHAKIYEWLQTDSFKSVDELNERVYAELFLTPSSDPWLGLFPADTYTAIQNEGIVK